MYFLSSCSANVKTLKNTVALYNIIPSLFWSIINLTPVAVFCYNLMELRLFLIFSSISFLTVFIPNSFLGIISIGKTTAVYKKIGVNFIGKFTQNGSVINKLIRKKHPDYRVLSPGRQSFTRVIRQTYFFEKFHLLLFVFFTLAAVHALLEDYIMWVIILFVTNLVYNVYPVLLQQYIRLKLGAAGKRIIS